MKSVYVGHFLVGIMIAGTACGENEPREPDLPQQPDRWVQSVVLDADSELKYNGKTRNLLITSVSTHRDLEAPQRMAVGDEIEGIKIGAIRCSFHWRDASYARDQFMWRGRWACMASRTRQEVENAVGREGERRFDYIHLGPVTLAGD
jgi:hypothetical protein